jgi:coenzyme F420-0:L-glutamate ligase/coenzyme F420-1:gamma-L-glutamate ligase
MKSSMTKSLEDIPANTLSGWIHERRSIRRYRPEPLPDRLIKRLLDAACHAPSAHNRQPWRFVLLCDFERKERLATAMGARLHADRTTDGDPQEAIEADAARSLARITTAPAVVVACLTLAEMDRYPDARRTAAERLMAVQSTAMAVQNLLLLAHAEGLGACWMCAPLFCPDSVTTALELPPDWEPQGLITLGYPATPGRQRARRVLAEIVRT